MPVKDERTIVHAITGEEIRFVERTSETDGEYVLIEVTLPAGASGPPLHYHESFEERFEVMSGELMVQIEEEKHTLKKGDTKVVPVSVPHMFVNESQEITVFQVKLTPGHYFEESMRIFYGMVDDGNVNEQGMPQDPMHAALLLKMQDTYILGLPSEFTQLMEASAAGRDEALQGPFKKYLP